MKTGPKAPNPRPENFVAEVNGHQIYKADGRFFLWTDGVGWWGFYIGTEEAARRTCETVTDPATVSA